MVKFSKFRFSTVLSGKNVRSNFQNFDFLPYCLSKKVRLNFYSPVKRIGMSLSLSIAILRAAPGKARRCPLSSKCRLIQALRSLAGYIAALPLDDCFPSDAGSCKHGSRPTGDREKKSKGCRLLYGKPLECSSFINFYL